MSKSNTLDSVDFGKYSLTDLKKFRTKLDREIEKKNRVQLKAARNKIKTIADEFGISVEEVLGVEKKPKRKYTRRKPIKTAKKPAATAKRTIKAKYRNPKDASQTWAGVGKRPSWLNEAIKGGADLNSFLIKK